MTRPLERQQFPRSYKPVDVGNDPSQISMLCLLWPVTCIGKAISLRHFRKAHVGKGKGEQLLSRIFFRLGLGSGTQLRSDASVFIYPWQFVALSLQGHNLPLAQVRKSERVVSQSARTTLPRQDAAIGCTDRSMCRAVLFDPESGVTRRAGVAGDRVSLAPAERL